MSFSGSGGLPPALAARFHIDGGDSGNQTVMNNQTLADFAKYLERMLGQQVSDDTGTTNRFNIKLQVQARPTESRQDALKRSILEQLGLELEPVHKSMQMLVVEKAN
jgi:uncharacterized protein (TIGR03435 family)